MEATAPDVRVWPAPLGLSRGLLRAGLALELMTLVVVAFRVPVLSSLGGGLTLALTGAALAAAGVWGLMGRTLFQAVSLSVEPALLHLGGVVRFTIRLRAARTVKLERVVLHVRCAEKAVRVEGEVRRGFQKRVWEKTTVLTEALVAMGGEPLVLTGELRLPVDRCSSFSTGNFAVEWSAAVGIEAAAWPATTRTWRLDVAPEVAA